jgi:opacity protein-like surface antigen
MCGASALAAESATTTTTTTPMTTTTTTTEAESTSPFYLHADVGPAFMQDLSVKGDGHTAMNLGARGDIAFGYRICPDFALELEAGAIWNEPKGGGGDLYQMPLLLNGIWNIQTHSPVQPYIGIGVGGVATHIVVSDVGTDTDYRFGCQGSVGVKYAMCPRTELDLSYKFFTSPFEHEWTINGTTVKFNGLMTHAVLVSFIYKF